VLGDLFITVQAANDQRKLHTQAAELIKTFQSMQPAEGKRLVSRANWIRNTDVCQSYYWRGKLGVTLLDMRNAKYWLDKSWKFCPEDAWKQRR
jgi:excinuclease UvrABC nuclease subunit